MLVKIQRLLGVFLLVLAANSALAAVSDDIRGFLVFETQGVENYVLNSKGNFALAGKASGQADDYITAEGNIYYLEKILGKVSKLGPDMKPISQEKIDHSNDVPYWLGEWKKGLLVLNNNQILYLDFSLKEVARLPLAPKQHDKIIPALNPKNFLGWKERGYLLANTGEVYIFPLDEPEALEPLTASISAEEGFDVDNLWIDSGENTLNLLGHTQKYDNGPGLKLGEKRVTSNDVVANYRLDRLEDAPKKTIVYEKEEIHYPAAVGLPDFPKDDGRIYERMPPYRTESKAKGIRIGLMTHSTPAYAMAFVESAKAFPPRVVIRLKSFGRYEVQDVTRDEFGTKFSINGKRYYAEEDLQQHVLRLLPESYARLKALPEMKDQYFDVMSY